MDKPERLLYIYTRLLNGKKLSKEELAQSLNVNIRSIQRDFSDINNFLYEDQEWEGLNGRIVYENNIGRHRLRIDRFKFKNHRILNLLFRMKSFTPNIHEDTYNLILGLNAHSNLAEKLLSNTLLNQFHINRELTESTLILKIQLAIENNQMISINDINHQTFKVIPIYTRYFNKRFWVTYLYNGNIHIHDLTSINHVYQHDESFDNSVFMKTPTVTINIHNSIWSEIKSQFIIMTANIDDNYVNAELIISKKECFTLALEFPQLITLLKPSQYVEDFKICLLYTSPSPRD